MLSQKTNIHHSALPKVGETGYLVMKHGRYGNVEYYRGRKQRYIVSHYPLCDNIYPYSRGIHTAFFRNLKNGEIVRVSGFYFEN